MATPRKNASSSRSGLATVRIQPAKVTVTFLDNGDNYPFPSEDVPDYLKFDGKFYVATNRDQTSIVFATPADNTEHPLRFSEFWHKEGEPPMITHDPGGRQVPTKKGGIWITPEQFTFSATYMIAGGKYKGFPMRQRFLPYDGFFRADGEEGEPVAGVKDARLEEWLVSWGYDFDNDTIPWSENLLVPLEKLLRRRKKVVLGKATVLGYLKQEDISELPAGLDLEDYMELLEKKLKKAPVEAAEGTPAWEEEAA